MSDRDHALLCEIEGYLRALHALWDDGDRDSGRVLASPAAYVQGLAGRPADPRAEVMADRLTAWCVLAILMLAVQPLAAQDRGLMVAADAALLIDAAQTITFRARGIEDMNPILGARPSTAGLVAYNAAWLALNTLPPPKLRRWINLATLAIEVGAIVHNRPYARWP